MKNAFEELLESISDEGDRNTISSLADKYKELKDGRLRQSDYSRKMQELSDEKKRLEKDVDELQQWRQWRTDHWLDDARATKEEAELQKSLEDANSKIAILEAAQEAGMTFEEVQQFIDKEMTKRNVVTKEYFEKEVKPKVVEQDFYKKDVDERIARSQAAMGYLFEETLPLGFSHRDEFGETFKVGELIKFANENKFQDISKAYDAWVSPKRQEIQKKKTEEMVAKAKEEGLKEGLKQAAMGANGRMPVDNGSPAKGHLEARLRTPKENQEKSPIPDDLPLGSGIASMVAQQYRQDSASGQTLKDPAA